MASLKTAVVFVADLSRALPIVHNLDFIALAGYEGNGASGRQVRLLKDLNMSINGRHVLLVEDIVDTGLTLNYLAKTLLLREPASLAAVTLLDRPYRRLVEDLPVRYVGFTVPDEFFVGYGFDMDERHRNLPDLRILNGNLTISSVAAERDIGPVPLCAAPENEVSARSWPPGGTSKARSASGDRKQNDRPLGTERPAPSGDDMPQA